MSSLPGAAKAGGKILRVIGWPNLSILSLSLISPTRVALAHDRSAVDPLRARGHQAPSNESSWCYQG
jgi:hypothetical protein